MRTSSCLTLLAALFVPATAAANCYSVYDTQNRLSFQSNVAPIDLSVRISESMRARFPSGYLVMIPDESECQEVRSGPTVQPRFGAIGLGSAGSPPNEQLLQASPLLRGTRPAGTSVEGGRGYDGDSREAVRSGTTLNIRREAPPSRP